MDFGFFCSVNHFSKGEVNANHYVTCSPSLAENDSRLLKNSEGNGDGEWIFCRRKEEDFALFLQVTRIRKIRKICIANWTSRLLPEFEQDDLKATNLDTRNKQNGSKSTNHKSETMNFWTRTSTHVFPKRSAKMIDGTKNTKFLGSLQNALRDTTNFAAKRDLFLKTFSTYTIIRLCH